MISRAAFCIWFLWFESVAYGQTAEASANRGIALFQAGKFDAAEKQFSEALKINPRLVEAQNLRGVALDQEGKHKEARACFQRAIAVHEAYAPAHANLALNAIQADEYPLAIAELRKALKLDPHLENDQELLYDLSLALYRTSAYEGSLQALDQMKEPSRDAGYYALAGADKRELGRGHEAQQDLEKALQLDPSNGAYLYDLAIALIQNGSPDEAIRRLEGGIENCSDCAQLHAALGVAYYATGKNSQAEDNYRSAVQLQPHAADLHAALGDLYVAAGSSDKALMEYALATNLDPQNSSYLMKQGRNWVKLQEAAKAEAVFRKALAIDPQNGEAYLSLAKIANQQERSADAVRNLEKAVSLQPENSAAWYQLALTYKKTGQDGKSAAALKRFRLLNASAQVN